MTGCYGSHPEDVARERELNEYLDKDVRQNKIQERADELYDEALNDEVAFNTLEENYEILKGHPGQIMRALRNLDSAIKGEEAGMCAVFTALSIIQESMKSVCEEIAEGEIE